MNVIMKDRHFLSVSAIDESNEAVQILVNVADILLVTSIPRTQLEYYRKYCNFSGDNVCEIILRNYNNQQIRYLVHKSYNEMVNIMGQTGYIID